MSDIVTLSDAERALRDFRAKVAEMPLQELNLTSIECEVRALTEALGREVMAVALKRADTDAPEVEIDGERWGKGPRNNYGSDLRGPIT
jgi:hypothetical protein